MVIITIYKEPDNLIFKGKSFKETLIEKLELVDPIIFKNFEEARTLIQKKSKTYILPTLNKSQRYEIFCKAKTLNQKNIIICFDDYENDLEAPNYKYKHDKPIIKFEEESDFDLIKKILFDQKEKKNFATIKRIDNSEYLEKISSKLLAAKSQIRKEYGNEKNVIHILEDVEKIFYKKCCLKEMKIEEVENNFRKVVEDELNEKGFSKLG